MLLWGSILIISKLFEVSASMCATKGAARGGGWVNSSTHLCTRESCSLRGAPGCPLALPSSPIIPSEPEPRAQPLPAPAGCRISPGTAGGCCCRCFPPSEASIPCSIARGPAAAPAGQGDVATGEDRRCQGSPAPCPQSPGLLWCWVRSLQAPTPPAVGAED